MDYAIAISAIAAAIALVALLVSLGSAARLNAMQPGAPLSAMRSSGLGAGAAVPSSAESLFKAIPFDLGSEPSLVFFTSGSCSACQSLLDSLKVADLGPFNQRSVVVNVGAHKDEDELRAAGIRFVPNGGELVSLFQVSSFPSWTVLNSRIVISQGIGNNLPHILKTARTGVQQTIENV
jgi:hypothetical protein